MKYTVKGLGLGVLCLDFECSMGGDLPTLALEVVHWGVTWGVPGVSKGFSSFIFGWLLI